MSCLTIKLVIKTQVGTKIKFIWCQFMKLHYMKLLLFLYFYALNKYNL